MAHSDATGDSVALPNYAGPLFTIGNQYRKTPLLTMTGGLTGGRKTGTDTFIMGNFLTLDAASASYTVTETASLTAPDSDIYAPTQVSNFVELHQRAFQISYKKRSMQNAISGEAVVGESSTDMGDPQKQRNAHLAQLAIDLEYSMFLGAGTDPTTAATNGKTRGLVVAIAADGNTEVDASGAAMSRDLIEQLEVAMLTKNTGMTTPVIFAGARIIQKLNELYGFAPESVTIGGVTLRQIYLPNLGPVALTYDPMITSTVMALVDVAKIAPVFMIVPGYPAVFFEPLAKTGASTKEQLYCQFGIDYTNVVHHGCIKDLSVS